MALVFEFRNSRARRSRMRRAAVFSAIATAFAIFLPSGGLSEQFAQTVLTGQKAATTGRVRSSRRILAAGELFSDDRLGLGFAIPLACSVRIQGRGNFQAVDVEPVGDERFFIYHTSYRIRRPGAPGELARTVFGPCALPEIPDAKQFDVQAQCEGTIGLNRIVRNIRLIRRDAVLHLFYLSYREDAQDLGRLILDSVRENPDFSVVAE
jgi:hypothetical protein